MTSFFLLTTTTFLMKIFILNNMWGYMNKNFAYPELRRAEAPNFASQNINPQNNKTLQNPATPFK
ncbi:MAG: hypothetical protein DRN21_04825, partial [Thermoplasmata archaeon]